MVVVNRSSVTIKCTLNFDRSLADRTGRCTLFPCIRLSVTADIDNVFVASIRFYGLPHCPLVFV